MIFNEPEENLCSSAGSVGDKINHSWENISTLKESKKFGDVRGKMYFCIKSAALQQLKRASLRSACMIFVVRIR